jgi:hypothetical protein
VFDGTYNTQFTVRNTSGWKTLNPQISNFMKIRPVGANCSMRTDIGKTDGRTYGQT